MPTKPNDMRRLNQSPAGRVTNHDVDEGAFNQAVTGPVESRNGKQEKEDSFIKEKVWRNEGINFTICAEGEKRKIHLCLTIRAIVIRV